MINKLKNITPYLISIIILAFGTIYFLNNSEKYTALLDFSLSSVLMLALVTVIFIVGNGITNYLLYRNLGAEVGLNESIGLASLNTLANYLPFAGGMVAKSVYLQKRYGLSYARFFSATLSLFVCIISANGLLGLSVLVYWLLIGKPVQPSLWIGFGGMAIVILGLFFPLEWKFLPASIQKKISQLLEGWKIIRGNRVLLFQLMAVQMLMMLISAMRFWLAFRLYSQNVTFGQSLLFATAIVLTQFVSITPGGLGVREAIVAALAATQNYDSGISVLVVATDRLIGTVVIILLGIVYMFILGRHAVEPVQVNE